MKKLSLLLVIFTTLVITACAVTTQESGVVKAEKRSSGFMGLKTNNSIEVKNAVAFKEKKRVVIGGFKVGFNESKKMSKKAGGGLLGGGFGGRSTGNVKLEGVSEATKQSITDQVYANFIADLKSAGYEVVARSKFTKFEKYKGTKEYDFPYENDSSSFLSEYGKAKYYSPRSIGSKQPIFMGEIQGVTGGFGFANPGNASSAFGEATGIAVLNVAYFVDFAGSTGHGNKWTSTSSMKVGQLLSVDTGYLGISSGHGGSFSKKIGNLTLGQPIASEKEFAKIVSDSSKAAVGVETAFNALSALAGGGTNQSRKFTYKANPAKYKSASIDALKKANDAFIGKMKELR